VSVSADPRIGSELLGYRVDALVGRGGMGVVYRAYDPRLKRNVALKLIAPELSADERLRDRFLVEAEAAAALEHPNVIPIHDVGEVDGQLYLAMRFVEGSDLKTLLKEVGALDPARALAICTQVADALDAAHARGLVHRDVKPSNVLLDLHEHVYLADFGLTRRLADPAMPAGEALSLGTPTYASPEQIEGGEVDGRADLYSLGCVLYECLTGEVPYPRASKLAVLWAHVQESPPRLSEHSDLPEGLDGVIATALAKDPDERYGTCRELVDAARSALGLSDVAAGPRRRSLRLAVLGTLVVAGALAAGLLLALTGGGPKPSLAVKNNTLVRIDPKTNRITAVVDVGRGPLPFGNGGPQAVAVGGKTVWVYNTYDRTVSAIDARTSELEQKFGVSGSPPGVIGNSIAADARGAWVVSSNSGKGLLTRLSLGDTYPLEVPFDGDPISVAVRDGGVWVLTKSALRGFAVLELDRRGALLARVRIAPVTAGDDPTFLAVGHGAVWVQGSQVGGRGTIWRIDPVATRVTATRELVPGGANGAGLATSRGALWAAFQPYTLLRVDPHTLRITEKITLRHPRSLAYDFGIAVGEDSVWWNGYLDGTVRRVDPATGKIVATVRVTPAAFQSERVPLAIAAGAGGVWVTVMTSVA
jgi:serine/threonine protein kinase